MIREQYASVTAASALPAASRILETAAGHGVDVADLLTRTKRRAASADAYRDSYRRYSQSVMKLDGVQLASFQLLASEKASHLCRDLGAEAVERSSPMSRYGESTKPSSASLPWNQNQ